MLNYAIHLRNKCLLSAINKSPNEVTYKVKPNVRFLNKLGCKVYTFIEKQFRTKFDSTAGEGVFLGFSDKSKSYIIGCDERDGTVKRPSKQGVPSLTIKYTKTNQRTNAKRN